MKKSKAQKDSANVEGIYRLQITEDGKVVGDSGWNHNQITNDGFKEFVIDWLTSGSGKSISHAALGTGTAPASNATSLNGELTQASNARVAVTSSIISSRTAQFVATFASSNSFITSAVNIANIGLFNVSTTGAGTIFSGNTFASSSLATNQNVNMTYQIRFVSA
jgi:hypothetical protein